MHYNQYCNHIYVCTIQSIFHEKFNACLNIHAYISLFLRYMNYCKFQVEFEDMFAEPVGSYSFDAIWRLSFNVFTTTKFWCYRILSLLCALPLSFCWGIYFACLTFEHIWCSVPSMRVFRVLVQPIGYMWSTCLQLIFEPFCTSVGLIFSNIRLVVKKDT